MTPGSPRGSFSGLPAGGACAIAIAAMRNSGRKAAERQRVRSHAERGNEVRETERGERFTAGPWEEMDIRAICPIVSGGEPMSIRRLDGAVERIRHGLTRMTRIR